MTDELALLFALIVVLAVASVLVLLWIMQLDHAEKRFADRMEFATSELARPVALVEERVPLAKSTQKSQKLKIFAAGLIDVDLNQAETYPVKWWLVPPATILVSWLIVEVASHPLGHRNLLTIFGWPVCALFVTRYAFNWLNNKRDARLLEQFPDALNSIVRSVRVGIPMAVALRTVAQDALEPTRAEFAILADKVSIGIPLDVALRELALRIRLTEYRCFATALTLQARSGGGITQTLETLADIIRKRVGLKARGYALTAEARTSAMILALLPFVAGAGIFVTQRAYAETLFDTRSGQSCLGAAILLMAAGIGIIQYMINNVLK